MGRPRIEIDKTDFESLLVIQCTLKEVAAFFDNKLGSCSEDTIERWCKRTYHKSFADISAEKRELGKISIRRAEFQMMERNASVLIFMAKNLLGQSDNPVSGIEGNDGAEDALSASLRELAEKGLESD